MIMIRSLTRIGEGAGHIGARVRSALEWRVYRPLHLRYAAMWRAQLNGVAVIGITGSAGKTSTKSMITAILRQAGKVRQTSGTGNRLFHVAEIIAATRPSDDFCVLELSAERPGYFDRLLPLARPTIGVVTTVGEDQYKAFGSREAIAAEKGKLITCLPADGTAVLNADDPLVRRMGEGFKGRIVTYGAAEGATLQVRDVRSQWPERLSCTVSFDGQDYPLQTQFCGKHWTTSVLAALATAVAAGIPLAKACEAVAAVPPVRARMEPVTTPDGITFIRDDWKGAFWGLPTVFAFLRDATAARKIVVIGTLADYHGSARTKYVAAGREALQVADAVVFVGEMATAGLRARKFAKAHQRVLAFPDVRQAAQAMDNLLRPGDLVMLKGSGIADHLGRLYHVRTGPVACWQMRCGKDMLCDACSHLRDDSAAANRPLAAKKPSMESVAAASEARNAAAPLKVFVGIGNPGEKYHNTPHNVGFSVLDLIAERNGLSWEGCGRAKVAQLKHKDGKVLLVKPQDQVNNTGKSLLALSQSMGFAAGDCVLVQDDIHLPAGTVRVRMQGGDGGHLGVRSTLVAFQTSDIPRIKIGVAAAANQVPTADYLVSPMPAMVSSKVREGCNTAVERLLKLAEIE